MDQPGIVAPQAFPIRNPKDKSKSNGRNINPPRYMEVGGLTGPGKWDKESVAKVEAPTGVSSGRRVGKSA